MKIFLARLGIVLPGQAKRSAVGQSKVTIDFNNMVEN